MPIIYFKSGKSESADLVIIADVSMSKTRSAITNAVPALTDTFCIEGEIFRPANSTPTFYKLVSHGNLAIVEDKKSVYPKETDILIIMPAFGMRPVA